MDLKDIYENVERRDIEDTTGPQTQSHGQDDGKDLKCRGSRCLVLITVGLGLICVLLLVFIILQHITITAERDLIKSYKNTVEELKQTINSLESFIFFMSTEEKSWSDSRQYCRDHGAELVIINTEEKQRLISSFITERVWIGLSDTEQEGNMKWVDNSPLNQGFWLKGEPNSYGGNEDCIELNYKRDQPGWSPLKSWNDRSCSEMIKGICEK